VVILSRRYYCVVFLRYFISKVSLRSLSKKIQDEDLIGGDLDEQSKWQIIVLLL